VVGALPFGVLWGLSSPSVANANLWNCRPLNSSAENQYCVEHRANNHFKFHLHGFSSADTTTIKNYILPGLNAIYTGDGVVTGADATPAHYHYDNSSPTHVITGSIPPILGEVVWAQFQAPSFGPAHIAESAPIVLNEQQMGVWLGNDFWTRFVVMHEHGHAMGLQHNTSGSQEIMDVYNGSGFPIWLTAGFKAGLFDIYDCHQNGVDCEWIFY